MDCVLPSPDPRHGRLEQQYRIAGALIGICIRSQLVQDFNFPPLVWEFLVAGQVSIERVFDVDRNYKSLIASLNEAEASGMEAAEFASKFHLKFTVFNVRGEEVPLTQRGKLEMVTISNCGNYVAMANEFRRNELKQYLEWMRAGFWENMGFSPIPGMSWRALEFCACGQKTFDVAMLKRVTLVEISSEQAAIFWRVVERFTAEERAALLKFATGTSRLPPRAVEQRLVCLKLNSVSGVDLLPTASTCFYQLHMPTYRSFETAYQKIRVAVLYTGTFENI
jgi:hypothetical protein